MVFLIPNKIITIITGLTLKEYLLTTHNPNKISMPAKRTASQPLIGVTLHNTDWLTVASDTTPAEQYVRATYNGNMGTSRVHYYVDDKCAWKMLDEAYTSWHSATGGQGQGNCNTISIECIMRNQTDAVSLASMENTAKLIAWIFAQYGWTVEKNLYTHNYWTNYIDTGALSSDLDAQSLKKCSSKTANPNGKYCPVFILPQWNKFKALVKKYMGVPASASGKMYRVQVGAYKEKAGADIAWASLTSKGYTDAFVTPKSSDGWYRVQVGSFPVKSNAENLSKLLKDRGYDNFIVES